MYSIRLVKEHGGPKAQPVEGIVEPERARLLPAVSFQMAAVSSLAAAKQLCRF